MAISIDFWYLDDSIRHSLNELILKLSTDQYGQVDNLSAYIECYEVIGGIDILIGKVTAHYDAQGATVVNLKSIYGNLTVVPDLSENNNKVQTGIAGELIRRIFVKVGDQFNFPISIEDPLLISDTINIASGFISPLEPYLHVVPNVYVLKIPNDFIKPMLRDQQDWIYVRSHDDGGPGSGYSIDLVYDDGSAMTHNITAFPTPRNFIINCGPKNMNDAYGITSIGLVRYDLLINDKLIQQYVVTDDCHPYKVVLAVDNHRGGMESFYLSGKKEWINSVSKENVQHYSHGDVDPLRGDYSNLFNSETLAFRVFTGYHPIAYIDHLRHLIGRDVWWVREDLPDKLIRLTTKTKSVNYKKDDEDLHGFSVEFEVAINNYPSL